MAKEKKEKTVKAEVVHTLIGPDGRSSYPVPYNKIECGDEDYGRIFRHAVVSFYDTTTCPECDTKARIV